MNLNYQVSFFIVIAHAYEPDLSSAIFLAHVYEPDSSSAKPISEVLDIYLVWNAVSANQLKSTDHAMHLIETNELFRL